MSAGRISLRQGDPWRLATNAPLVLGSLGLLAILVMALFGPQLAPADPQAQRVILFYPDGSFEAPPTPPNAYNVLGTDPLGRDQLSRLLWGARLTFTIVLLALLGRGLLAVVLGVVAGWRRGTWIDAAIGHAGNAVGGLPQLMFALLIVIALQGQGMAGFIVALALVGWAELAQFVRAEVVRVAATPHVEAARALGATGAHVVRTHVLRDLAPQILGLLALEAGSVLLLLAELGFIGFFVAGGVFYVDDSGRPILPVRDRAPEWGQMLAGARSYAFRQQYVAFVPGVVVVGAVLAFNLFAEGLRTASDPFSPRRLSPRTLGSLARGVLAGALVAATAFGYVSATTREISYEDGLRRAREAAERVLPGSQLIAGVARFTSSAHALAKPEKLNYYFRSAEPFARIVRIGFIDADANAMEVKLHENDDGLLLESFRPLPDVTFAAWQDALAAADRLDGGAFRSQTASYLVRVVLAQEADADRPLYRVQYGRETGGIQREIQIDAESGSTSLAPSQIPAAAAARARPALSGGEPRLIRTAVTWRSSPDGHPRAFGASRPAQYHFDFVRGDIDFPRLVRVSMEAGAEAVATVGPFGQFGTGADTRTMPVPPFSVADLVSAFEKVEAAGMRVQRERALVPPFDGWEASAFSARVGERWLVNVSLTLTAPTQSRFVVTYRYDPQTGEISEIQR